MANPIFKEIFLTQGVDFSATWKLRAERSVEAADLTGYTFASSFKRNYTSSTSTPIGASIGDAEGDVDISIDGSNTVNLKPGRYVFDVLATGEELPTRILWNGIIHLAPAVNKPS